MLTSLSPPHSFQFQSSAMGDNNNNDEEMLIPLFTVLKNGAILKNIFIVNESPASSARRRNDDDVLIVGRHPDCNIVLTHPSISRFHLQIHSNTSSRKLSVLDLSSVHGTWVSERKIDPGVSVEMKEGDTLRIGASSRVYRLHWIPISYAYDLENPFVSEMDVAAKDGKVKEHDAVPEEEEEEEVKEIVQNVDNEEVPSMDSILESIECLFSDENMELIVKKEIPSEPPILEDFIPSYCDEEGKTTSFSSGPFITEASNFHANSEIEHKVCDIEFQVPSPSHVEPAVPECDNLNTAFEGPEKISDSVNLGSSLHVEEDFMAYPEANVPRETNILSTLSEYLRESICLPVVEAVQGTNVQHFEGVQQNALSDAFTSLLPSIKQKALFVNHLSNMLINLDPESIDRTGASRVAEMPKETGVENLITEKTLMPVEEATLGTKFQLDKDSEEVVLDSLSGVENLITEKTLMPVEEATLGTEFQLDKDSEEVVLDSLSDGGRQYRSSQEHKSNFQPYENTEPSHENSVDGTVQDIENKCPSVCLISLPAESLNKPLPEKPMLEITNRKNQTPLMSVSECSEKKISTSTNIWSRRGKAPANAPQIRTSKGKVKSTAHFDTKVDVSNKKDNKDSMSRDLSSVLDREEDEEEEVFTPDKENFSPNTLQSKFLKKKSNLEDTKHSKSRQRLNKYSKGCLIPFSEKENQTLKVAKEQKSERRPFGSHNKFEEDISHLSNQKATNKTIPKDLLSGLDEEEEEIHTPDKENFGLNTLQLRFLRKKGKLEDTKHSKSMQRLYSSKGCFSLNAAYKDEIPLAEKGDQILRVAQEQKSERGLFGSQTKFEQDISDFSSRKDIEDEIFPKDLLSDLDEEEEEEIYTLDKENFSPNSLQLQSLKKKGKLQEEINLSKSSQISHSSNANFSSNIYPDEINSPISEKENQTPRVDEEQKSNRRPFGNHIELKQEQDITLEKRQERLPFQSLLINSGGMCRAEASHSISAMENANPSLINERSWTMVVDTASLLNKESRKALLLLQGLKGTRLIIPRMVLKELDSMKREFSFFRRKSEASLALEWIEECMVKTKWWIHVQSSMEDGRLIAPTPPAIPQTQFSDENWNLLLSSSHKSSMEMASPTTEDHILDCALLYRTTNQNGGQLVLLSDDVTLKIKSMAEGILCETVQEFRESLVNPFSERFLWANSSPRGLTWSCQDDVVLRQKYSRSPTRKSSKEVAKGLKLILLHNSRYGQKSVQST